MIASQIRTLAKAIGGNLRARRKQLGMTLEQVVTRTRGAVTIASLQQYEVGKQLPNLWRWIVLCEVLQVEFAELLPRATAEVTVPSGK